MRANLLTISLRSTFFQYSLFLLFTVYSLFAIIQAAYTLNAYIPSALLAVSLATTACISIMNGYDLAGSVKTTALEKIIVFFYLSNLYAILMVTLMYNLDLPLFIGFQILVIVTRGFFLTPPLDDYCCFISFTLTLIYVSYFLLKLENPLFSHMLLTFFASWVIVQVEIWWKWFNRNVNKN